jgi:adenylate cyclase
MAVFGIHESKPSDARRGIECGFAIVDAISDWNEERRAGGGPMVAIGVGLHYGMAAFGPSGDGPTIIGDTVNVASRLERLTRRPDTAMAVSDEILRAVSEQDSELTRARLRSVVVVRLSGCGPHRVWIDPPFPWSKS